MKKNRNEIIKRSKSIALSVTLIFTLLIARLYFIQIKKGEEYSKYASNQQIFNIESSLPRGIIFDRNGIRITNQNQKKVAYILIENIKNDKNNINILKEALNYNDSDMKKLLNSQDKLIEIPLNRKNIDIYKLSSIKDVIIIDKNLRHNKENILSHVIGYVNEKENEGKTGLEKTYDKEPLKTNINYGKKPIFIDARRRIIPSMDIDLNNNDIEVIPNSLKLTIDYNIQKQVENILDKNKKRGAVVVSEVKTGDILAMASRPNINLRDMNQDLNKKDHRLYNKAIQLSYPPGSIFKIPVLLAGLKSGQFSLEDEVYCKGYEQLDNNIIRCNNKDGHGKITILEGFYKSCNSTFIQIGKKVGAEEVIDMAKSLGLGNKINIGIDEEIKGNLPKDNELIGAAIGNISIGQGNIEVTPLQITNMTMILANNGIKKDLSIVDSYVTEEGIHGKKIKRDKDKRVIPKELSEKLRKGLDNVVEKGTAKNIDLESIGGGGGKTGSAQAILNKKQTVHAWFTGYFPKDNPEYVITVFIEGGDSGSGVAAPIFEDIAKEIYKNYKK